ncbi:MAG: hypothetical protein C0192_04235 [Desulfurella multipotens]|nr:MAG: hypothetical protein C0192_04235 [Desulfurella multipotens]
MYLLKKVCWVVIFTNLKMKLNFDIGFIEQITKIPNNQFKEKLDYFCNLPLKAQIEIFHQMKIFEEEDENAFFMQNYDKNKVGEYRFGLFLLAIDKIINFENNATKSNYSKSKIKKLRE